jgi:hypothetical protein
VVEVVPTLSMPSIFGFEPVHKKARIDQSTRKESKIDEEITEYFAYLDNQKDVVETAVEFWVKHSMVIILIPTYKQSKIQI